MMEVEFNVAGLLRAIDAEGLRVETARGAPTSSSWFFYLRVALQGLSGRLYGARLHYNAAHSWWPRRIVHSDLDYHISNCLFGLDSAIECLTFGLNALGNGADVSQFHDVTDEAALRRINPGNIIGQSPRPGYATFFPNFQAHWIAHKSLIEVIFEHHDVTKHRYAAFGSGTFRNDPPDGFFDGIAEDERFWVTPLEVIILGPEAKKPILTKRTDWQNEPYGSLEKAMAAFKPFIEESLRLALEDAKKI